MKTPTKQPTRPHNTGGHEAAIIHVRAAWDALARMEREHEAHCHDPSCIHDELPHMRFQLSVIAGFLESAAMRFETRAARRLLEGLRSGGLAALARDLEKRHF